MPNVPTEKIKHVVLMPPAGAVYDWTVFVQDEQNEIKDYEFFSRSAALDFGIAVAEKNDIILLGA